MHTGLEYKAMHDGLWRYVKREVHAMMAAHDGTRKYKKESSSTQPYMAAVHQGETRYVAAHESGTWLMYASAVVHDAQHPARGEVENLRVRMMGEGED